MRTLLVLACSLLLGIPAYASNSNFSFGLNMHRGYGVDANCPYGSAYADGCSTLSAAGHIGLYTFNSVNSLGAGNAFFTNTTVGARQSGQASYATNGVSSAHPFPWNQAGGDYGIGPYTADGSLALAYDSTNGAWSGTNFMNPALSALGCSYIAVSKFIRCDFTGSGAAYAPTAITGSINASGVLTIASGTIPALNSYVYYATAEAEPVTDQILAPYKVSSVIDGTHVQLAGGPPTISTQNLSWAPAWTLSGYLFKDMVLYMQNGGGGVLNITNNKFLLGVNNCNGAAFSAITVAITNTTGWVTSNYAGMQTNGSALVCSPVASLYPTIGGASSTFTGSTSTASLTIAATIASGSMTVTSVSGGYIALGTQVTGTGLPTGITYVTGFTSGTKGGIGVYTVKTCTGGVTSSQSCAASSSGTVTGGTNYVLAVNSLTTGAVYVYSFVNAAGFTSPVSYQIIDTDGTNFYLSPSTAVPTLSSVAMSTGPIESGTPEAFSVGNTGGYLYSEYNYVDNFASIFAANQTAVVYADFNFIHSGNNPATHGDPIIHHFPNGAGTPAASSVWDIAFQDQSFNTAYTDKYSVSGQVYGDVTGIRSNGGYAGNMTFVPNNGSTVTGSYYIKWGYWRLDNNILIANVSQNNYTSASSQSSAYLMYILGQGAYGNYPVLTGTFDLSNNIVDSVSGSGAFGSAYVSVCPVTTVGGTTHVSPTFSGNFDVLAGTTVSTYTKDASCP